jgi:hypothetical protein
MEFYFWVIQGTFTLHPTNPQAAHKQLVYQNHRARVTEKEALETTTS